MRLLTVKAYNSAGQCICLLTNFGSRCFTTSPRQHTMAYFHLSRAPVGYKRTYGNPVSQVIQGFARFVRKESKTMRSGTVSVIESRGAASIVDKVLFIFSSTILDHSEDFEREFMEEVNTLVIKKLKSSVNGQCIPRN